jgi:hypothetical protein
MGWRVIRLRECQLVKNPGVLTKYGEHLGVFMHEATTVADPPTPELAPCFPFSPAVTRQKLTPPQWSTPRLRPSHGTAIPARYRSRSAK